MNGDVTGKGRAMAKVKEFLEAMEGELELEVQVGKALVGWFSAEGALIFWRMSGR